MQYSVTEGKLTISVDTLGAELRSIVFDGKERLWQNQTGDWKGRAPILFPVCGHFDVRVDGKEYPIPPHGFTKKAEFTLKEEGKNSLTFLFKSSEKTKKMYPYDFELEVEYSVAGERLTIKQTVKNPSQTDMYFTLGGHESFALDKPLAMHELIFEKEEDFVHFMHTSKGYLSEERKYFGKGKKFIMPVNFLINGKTIIFGGLKSRKVQLRERDGGKKPLVNITFDGFENLLLWHCAGGNYICIEPWLNLPDPLDEKREFSQKPGVVKLAGKEEKVFVRTFEYL
jgi:galactose mutarotase-like enzyme